jgi:hypothetical protein
VQQAQLHASLPAYDATPHSVQLLKHAASLACADRSAPVLCCYGSLTLCCPLGRSGMQCVWAGQPHHQMHSAEQPACRLCCGQQPQAGPSQPACRTKRQYMQLFDKQLVLLVTVFHIMRFGCVIHLHLAGATCGQMPQRLGLSNHMLASDLQL